jgi:integrase
MTMAKRKKKKKAGILGRIDVVCPDDKRRKIRPGRMSKDQFDSVKRKVRQIAADRLAGAPHQPELAKWIGGITGTLRKGLERCKLIGKSDHQSVTLCQLLDEYFKALHVKPNTIKCYLPTRYSLEKHFGTKASLSQITPLGAEQWRQSMKAEKLSVATISKRVGIARHVFKLGMRWKLATENPFVDVPAGSQVNKSREYFLSKQDAAKVSAACPDAEWRLIFALARYGGLRCPSEIIAMRWEDVIWDSNRFLVHSSKTEHHPGHETRWVPIFTELRPYLLEALEQAEEGTTYCINRYRVANANLRTQLRRIIKRAGLTPWAKPFQNLRSTRETELQDIFPAHIVCAWIGNSERVAQKHYLQITDSHFEKAAQNPAQQGVESAGTESQLESGKAPIFSDLPVVANPCGTVPIQPIAATGVEPVTLGL